jgi:predicted CXXCH cytochrome family protein
MPTMGVNIPAHHTHRGLPSEQPKAAKLMAGMGDVKRVAIRWLNLCHHTAKRDITNQMHGTTAVTPLGKFAALLIGMMFATNGVIAETSYTGNEVCANCHEQAVTDWRDSHHDLAMQEASTETVLGDFNDATFSYYGVTTTFTREGDAFFIETDNAAGELETYPVAYVFGVEPLQQYLLPLGNGRLQALSVAWDTRPESEGGQRWYHLYPDEHIAADDPLHWTGGFFNWNTSCAECHSTDVKKRYDAANNQFDTHYAQIDVGCEACHGPGSEHVALANEGSLSSAQTGFAMSLKARGEWRWADGADIAQRSKRLTSRQQIDTCGRCHARRGTLGEYHPGRPLLDTHRLAIIEEPLYWPDGQIRDEVYVYGSFIQSKMHQAGVVCTNCHNPHSNQLVVEGNGLCAQCHVASTYDNPAHHRHQLASAGSACVDCHMPSQLYMGVDARRDHSMRIPRPDLSVSTGAPNACNQCHTDQSASWAYSALTDWGVTFADRRTHPARAFHAAGRGDVRAAPVLIETANNKNKTAMLRASAITQLGRLLPDKLMPSLSLWLESPDPLVRLAAVEAVGQLPPEQRQADLIRASEDPVLAVRMIAAEQLAAIVPVTDGDGVGGLATAQESEPGDAPKAHPNRLGALFDEYVTVQSQHLDMPSVLTQLAGFQQSRGNEAQAETLLLSALQKNPQASAARVNLADLYRTQDKEANARRTLETGIQLNQSDASLWFSLALLEVRAGNGEPALGALKTAAALEETPGYYHYVYAVAQHDQGRREEALTTLKATHRAAPGQPNVLAALARYSQLAGDVASAQRYQSELRTTLQRAGL